MNNKIRWFYCMGVQIHEGHSVKNGQCHLKDYEKVV